MSATIQAIRNTTYDVVTELVVWECPVGGCGIVYGIPRHFADALRSKGGSYWCPNGHSLSWNETDTDRAKKRAEAAESRARQAEESSRFWRDREKTAQRSNAAYRGHLTRIKNRIANGVCPVAGCKRSGFANVMSHIAQKHPEWRHEHADDLS